MNFLSYFKLNRFSRYKYNFNVSLTKHPPLSLKSPPGLVRLRGVLAQTRVGEGCSLRLEHS